MGHTVQVPIHTKMAGVVTEVHQRLDLTILSDTEFKRILNAAQSGLVTGERGYIASLLKQLCEKADILPPFILSTDSSWYGMSVSHPWTQVDSPVSDQFDELMKLSAVRSKMRHAANPPKPGWNGQIPPAPQPTRNHSQYRRNHWITLPGWTSTTELRKLLAKGVCKHPDMVEARNQLAALVLERPVVNLVTKEF